jgi:ABC-type polysaccharide/polyol phosphate export permease
LIPAASASDALPARATTSPRIRIAGLIWTLVRTDFKARYHGTFGGFAWALLKPLVMFLSLVAVFSFVFHSEPNYRSNLLIGLFLWDFFAESTRVGLISLQMKGFLLTKAKFPTWILVVTSMSNALITLTVFSVAMVAFLALSGHTPGIADVALYTTYLFSMILVVTGLSLATSVLFLRYRDLNQVWDVVSQAGFFLTPIIWPIGAIPERFHFYLYIWPPTPIVDFARQVLIAGTIPSLKANLFLGTETLIIFLAGVLIFRRLAPRAAEYL